MSKRKIQYRPRVTKEVIAAMTMSIYSAIYDDPKKIPKCHMEWWDLCLSPHRLVSIAAPRGHAKSTAINFAYVLTMILFREFDYILILSNTEDQASKFLQEIATGIQELEGLEDFGIERTFVKKNEGVLEGRFTDGAKYRLEAKGASAQVRGTKWMGKRPNLIICDDLEDKETAESETARPKFQRKFKADILPALSKKGKIRMVGTILHMDSVLQNTLENPSWRSKCYEAHNDDFSQILWPEEFPKERLMELMDAFRADGELDLYNQEYRNIPISKETALFNENSFRPMSDEHFDRPKTYYIIIDPAVTTAQKSDPTAIGVYGTDSGGNIHVVDMVNARMDTVEWMDILFQLHKDYQPELVVFETGTIANAITPFLDREMIDRNYFFAYQTIPHGGKDKVWRAKAISHRCRARKVYVNENMDNYEAFIQQCFYFPKGKHDDMVDTFSYMGQLLNTMTDAPTREEEKDAEDLAEWERDYYDDEDLDLEHNVVNDYYDMMSSIDPDTGY